MDFSDIFGSKERKELRALRHIVKQQEELLNSNSWLQQMAARINRYDTEEGHIALMMYELQLYLLEDKESGASQLNLNARPLFLVLDMGLEQTAIAFVRGGKALAVEAQVCIPIGGAAFEVALSGWVQKYFPMTSQKKNNTRFIHSAQRICSLLCQGAPFGEVEETIAADSCSVTVTLPLSREELAPVFLPLLGTDGSVIKALRQLVSDKRQSQNNIDRIICLGVFSRLPLFREALADAFNCQVLMPERLPTIALADWFREASEREKRVRFEQEERMEKKEEERINKACVVKSVVIHKQLVNEDKEVNHDLLFEDAFTGLIWTRNAGLGGNKMSWRSALGWVKNLNYAGYNDWRLPTSEELKMFVQRKRPLNGLNASACFYLVHADCYWTDNSGFAWVVNMTGEDVMGFNGSFNYYVWPVRSRK